jgi:hypothetical protein
MTVESSSLALELVSFVQRTDASQRQRGKEPAANGEVCMPGAVWMSPSNRAISAKLGFLFVTMSGVLALFISSPFVLAHDSWISRNQFYDPISGAWCCDEHDCSTLDDVAVRQMDGGFIIEDRHFVARHRVLPSSDDQYWACFNTGGKGPHGREKEIRCFFAPMNT